MTHRAIRVLEDGTRVYASYHRYKPLEGDERKYGVNKPDDPRAVRFYGKWFLPLDLVPDDERVMPETRSDEEAYYHGLKTQLCRCHVCLRPEAQVYRIRARDGYNLQGGRPRSA